MTLINYYEIKEDCRIIYKKYKNRNIKAGSYVQVEKEGASYTGVITKVYPSLGYCDIEREDEDYIKLENIENLTEIMPLFK